MRYYFKHWSKKHSEIIPKGKDHQRNKDRWPVLGKTFFWGGIFLSLSLIFRYFQGDVDSWVFSIELTGLGLALYAAYEATNASVKSIKTYDGLVNVALLARDSKDEFDISFREHLIESLQKYKDEDSIYLLLSTPAYGFAVVSKETFELFRNAILDIPRKCKSEFIFFSPDAHFNYWCNVLLWSIEEEKNHHKSARDFASEIKAIMESLMQKNTKIWITRETTLRIFGFAKKDEAPKAYIMLVDRFSIPQDQLGKSFRSHSIPIIQTQVKEFINEVKGEIQNKIQDSSYFNRIKQCPYTLKNGEDASLDLDPSQPAHSRNKFECEMLLGDYVLGRTSQKQIGNFTCFKDEINLFIKSLQKQEAYEDIKELKPEEIIIKAINKVIHYFFYIITSIDFKTYLKTSQSKQLQRINFVLDKIEQKKVNIDNGHIDQLKTLIQTYELKKLDVEENLWDDAKEEFWKLQYLLYILLTSGFEESEYYHCKWGGGN